MQLYWVETIMFIKNWQLIFLYISWFDGLGPGIDHHSRNGGICQQKLPTGPGIWPVFSNARSFPGVCTGGGLLATGIDLHIIVWSGWSCQPVLNSGQSWPPRGSELRSRSSRLLRLSKARQYVSCGTLESDLRDQWPGLELKRKFFSVSKIFYPTWFLRLFLVQTTVIILSYV